MRLLGCGTPAALRRLGPEVEMVLGGVVDSPDCPWCEGLDMRHSCGAVEK
jgi:hypothetical protein